MKTRTGISIDPKLHKKAKKMAKDNGLSLSAFFAFLICRYEKSVTRDVTCDITRDMTVTNSVTGV